MLKFKWDRFKNIFYQKGHCRSLSPATLVGKFRYSRDWWPVPHIVVVVAWWPTLSSPSKSCTLSEHLTPDSINLGGDLAAHIKSSL